jgi:signal transduction histidine kinase
MIKAFRAGSSSLSEISMQDAEGQAKVLDVSVTAALDAGGHYERTVWLWNDVTGRANDEVRRLHAQKLESIEQLAAGIAHEINTPTQYVGDNLRFINDAMGDLEAVFQEQDALLQTIASGDFVAISRAAESLKKARDEADMDFLRDEIGPACEQGLEGVSRIARIVGAMREFSHPGGQDFERVDINAAIESTAIVAHNAYKYVADLDLDLATDLPALRSRGGQFGQVVLNLVVNAAHAIAEAKQADEDRGVIRIRTRLVDT